MYCSVRRGKDIAIGHRKCAPVDFLFENVPEESPVLSNCADTDLLTEETANPDDAGEGADA